MKIGRNKPCPCGSGAKFKHCHGRGRNTTWPPVEVIRALSQHQAQERIRERQQGLGRGIVSLKAHDHQLVAVGNRMYGSRNWKTFHDFLDYYLKQRLGPQWGKSESDKPPEQQHTILAWHRAMGDLKTTGGTKMGEVHYAPMNGATACYLSLAYGLYLLAHNVELQDRLLRRLRDPGQFQGAYFEVLVASALIRGGFELTLEDESDRTSQHCEYTAVSKATGRKYGVEAKMRGVVGVLGRTIADGTSREDPLSHLVPQLNAALRKPAADERMIFIDLNTPMPPDVSEKAPPAFADRVSARLERYEAKELKQGEKAYVFVTNLNLHRELHGPPSLVVVPFGLGIPDFNRTSEHTLAEQYRREQVHADAQRVGEAFTALLNIPVTFDGSLPSVSLHGMRAPVTIGETYNFEGAGRDGNDLAGTVTAATVIESEHRIAVAVTDSAGKAFILKEPINDEQLAEYRANPDAYFGKVVPAQRKAESPYDLFKFFMEAYKGLERTTLLEKLGGASPELDEMSDDALLILYCERLATAAVRMTSSKMT